MCGKKNKVATAVGSISVISKIIVLVFKISDGWEYLLNAAETVNVKSQIVFSNWVSPEHHLLAHWRFIWEFARQIAWESWIICDLFFF